MARILIVIEDEPVFSALADCLGRDGHTVERGVAASGRKGACFDVLVADTPAPDWCGVDFLREVRVTSPGVKVILLTGEAESSSVGYLPAVARFGAVCTLRKPFDGPELVEAVRWALSPDAGGRGGVACAQHA